MAIAKLFLCLFGTDIGFFQVIEWPFIIQRMAFGGSMILLGSLRQKRELIQSIIIAALIQGHSVMPAQLLIALVSHVRRWFV